MTKWDEEVFNRAKELRLNGNDIKTITQKLNEEFNINKSEISVKRKLENEGIRVTGVIEKDNNKILDSSVCINGDGTHTSNIKIAMTRAQSKSKEYVLEAHGYDPTEWQIKQATNNIWEQNSQEQGTSQLYQSKIVVEPIKNKLTEEKIINILKSEVKPVNIKSLKKGKRNLVIPLADLHFGVTKYKDVEKKLSEMFEIISKGYKTIVIEQLGDLFHSSQLNASQTLKGTILNEVDMEQAIEDAKKFFDVIIQQAILCSNKVIIKHVQGNHSGNLEYMFLIYLEAKYPQIQVDYHIRYRDAYMLDNVLIGIAHGDYAKKNLPSLLQTEYKHFWGKCTTAEVHTGHFHTEKTEDIAGVMKRQFGTLKPSDKHEIQNGWTLAKKKIQLIEYNKNEFKKLHEV